MKEHREGQRRFKRIFMEESKDPPELQRVWKKRKKIIVKENRE